MSNQLVIRPVERSDHEQWLGLWTEYNRFYGRFGETALAPEITAATWQRFFDVGEPVHALVAADGAQLVGLAHFVLHRSTTALNPIIYLQDLFTDESARGRGVGRALIEAVYAEGRGAGIERVYWQTHETNVAAIHLYDQLAERSGFIVYRHRPQG